VSVITRRSLLIAGSGALAALAGCSGNGESDGGSETSPRSTTTSQPTTATRTATAARPASLEIENPVLCAEQPAGYREYTSQPEATYEPGDIVWLYFEPSTTGTESAGEGELRFEYDFTVSVTGPDGENLGTVEDTASKTIPGGSDLSSVFLAANFSPPTEFEAGTHTLEVEVTDTIAGNTASTTVEFEVEFELERTAGELGFGRFVFIESQAREYRDYDEKPSGEYGPTEKVWYYYEIDGFAYEETANGLTHDLQLAETLTGPEGDVWSQVDIPLSHSFEPDTDLDTYWVTDSVSPSNEWLAGEYELQFELTDGYTSGTVTESYTYTVVE
jgi:hypothetical protein